MATGLGFRNLGAGYEFEFECWEIGCTSKVRNQREVVYHKTKTVIEEQDLDVGSPYARWGAVGF